MLNRIQFCVSFLIILFLVTPAMAQVPSDLMENCNQWKITYPTGDEDKTLCGEPNNEYFYVNEAGDAIVFRVPIKSDNGSTPNSSYIRSELREREPDGSVDIYWTTEGAHLIYVKQAITHLPINKPHLVATQIHGNKSDGIDDAMVMRLEGSHLFLSFNGGVLREDLTIKTDYVLGTIHEVIFLVEDGKHYCYYSEDGDLLTAFENGTAVSYLVKDGSNDYVMDINYDDSYFKVGNYTQSNPDKEGNDTDDPDNYGEVLVYDFFVVHDSVDVSGVSITPEEIELSIGAIFQLSTSIIPTNATNKGVEFVSSDASIVEVNSNGVLSAISSGEAYVTVLTEEGGYTDTSFISVVADPVGPNLALNKPITGTGIHDDVHEVSNVVDGLTSTRWSVSGFPQTAIIDLGEFYTVGRTELVCYSDRAYRYTVSISDSENGTYTPIVDRSENTSQGTAMNPIVDVFSGVDGRFVKITVTDAAFYTGPWVSLSEFRVFAASPLGNTYNIPLEKDISVWPNPALNGVFFSDTHNMDYLTIFDRVGKAVMKQVVLGNSVDISELESGLYIFRFSDGIRMVDKPVVKK